MAECNVPEVLNGVELSYSYQDVKVAIIRGQDPNYSKIESGESVKFVPEPENQYDKSAIMVFSNEMKLGYLYKGRVKDIVSDFLEAGHGIFAAISSIDESARKITICIGLYRKKEPKKQSKIFRLAGNTNEEMQDNIMCCSEEDLASASYDFEKDKYLISSGVFDIGYCPVLLKM